MHSNLRTRGAALIIALTLLSVAILPVLAGLHQLLYQTRLVSGIIVRQELQTAARRALSEAMLEINTASTFPTFSPQRWKDYVWPAPGDAVQHAYLIETLTPTATASSPNHLIVTAHASHHNGHEIFLRASYQLFPDGTNTLSLRQIY